MKRLFFFAFIVLIFQGVCISQVDTLDRYPYFFYYNWPELGAMHDSILCTHQSGVLSPLPPSGVNYLTTVGGNLCELAFFQHTDDTILAIGLAASVASASNYFTKIVIYDSAMNEIVSISDSFNCYRGGTLTTPGPDEHMFYSPGLLKPDFNGFFPPYEFLCYVFFKDDTLRLIGDFYIALSFDDPIWNCYTVPAPRYMAERHEAPYNFHTTYRLNIDGVWHDTMEMNWIPEILVIQTFPCEPIDSVSLVAETDGCLHVDWDAPKLQSLWTVSLTLPDGSEIVQQTDTNHWEYCGIIQDARYAVKIRSRCDDIDGVSWSDWSREFSIGHQAIEGTATEPPFTVSPNPASGTVTVDCDVADGTIEVVDMQGRTLMAVPSTQRTLDISRLAAGSYVVRLTTPQGTAVRRLQVE